LNRGRKGKGKTSALFISILSGPKGTEERKKKRGKKRGVRSRAVFPIELLPVRVRKRVRKGRGSKEGEKKARGRKEREGKRKRRGRQA